MKHEFKSNLTINGTPLQKSFVFPGGELQIKLPERFIDGSYNIMSDYQTITIKTILNSSDAIMELILVKKALKHYCPDKDVDLICWYMPYLRQDRICSPGECYSAFEFLDLLDSMKFRNIYSVDFHSNKPFIDLNMFVYPKVYHSIRNTRFNEYTQLDIISKIFDKDNIWIDSLDKLYDILVAPDKGAVEKVDRIAKHYNMPMIVGNKIRNPGNGAITQYDIDVAGYSLEGKKLLVIDDICDGGGTFVLLANELQKYQPNSIDLFVTHGIFSKGIDHLHESGYDGIITTDSLFDEERKLHYEKMDGFAITPLNALF